MATNQPKTEHFEQISIDHRDRKLTNEQIDFELDKLDDNSKPYFNASGFELNDNSRFVNFCKLVSYYTDEKKLNSAIVYIEKILGTNIPSIEAGDFIKSLDMELYSPNDLIKIKAIYFSLLANYLIFTKTFCDPTSFVPEFEINLLKRVFIHDFPKVQALVFQKSDVNEKELAKKLPTEKEIEFHNNRIETLTDLDHQHGTKISKKKIKYHEKRKKFLIENVKLARLFPQQNGTIKTDEEKEFLKENRNHFIAVPKIPNNNEETVIPQNEPKPKKIPEKWHALLYWFELRAHNKELPVDIDGSFLKSELEITGAKRCNSTGQSFYKNFVLIDINNPKMLKGKFGKDWKEKILKIAENDNVIIDYINNKYM